MHGLLPTRIVKLNIHSGVPSHHKYDVLFSTGLSQDTPLAHWDLLSVDAYRQQIKDTNDGTLPAEPYQRLSQEIFERWFKTLLDAHPLIDNRYGMKVEGVTENADSVDVDVTDLNNNTKHVYRAQYVVGCDGAGSHVRRSMNIPYPGDLL